MPEIYEVMTWEWDEKRQEYIYRCAGGSDDHDLAVAVFRSIKIDADTPQAELWRNGEEEDERLAYRVALEGDKEEEIW